MITETRNENEKGKCTYFKPDSQEESYVTPASNEDDPVASKLSKRIPATRGYLG